MIQHLLRFIWNQRKSNGWLMAELFLISVSLWYIVDYMLVTATLYHTPLGFDICHTYQFQFNVREEGAEGYVPASRQPETIGKELLEAIERLGHMPATESVALSYMALPYNRFFNGINLGRDSVSQGLFCYTFYITPSYFEVYRIQPLSGPASALAESLRDGNIILSEDAALGIFHQKEVAGQTVYNDSSWPQKVGAVSQKARLSEFERVAPRVYLPLSATQISNFPASQLPWADVSVRVKPGTPADFPQTFMREHSTFLSSGNLYLQSITPLSTLRENNLRPARSDMNNRLSILFFLLANIFLAIVGTFWLRTRSRKGEMGLRMALGSTRRQLRKLMLGEGLLLAGLSFIPALAVCCNIVLAGLLDTQVMENTFLRFIQTTLITCILIAGMVVAGIWYPASEAARLQPADALHEE